MRFDSALGLSDASIFESLVGKHLKDLVIRFYIGIRFIAQFFVFPTETTMVALIHDGIHTRSDLLEVVKQTASCSNLKTRS